MTSLPYHGSLDYDERRGAHSDVSLSEIRSIPITIIPQKVWVATDLDLRVARDYECDNRSVLTFRSPLPTLGVRIRDVQKARDLYHPKDMLESLGHLARETNETLSMVHLVLQWPGYKTYEKTWYASKDMWTKPFICRTVVAFIDEFFRSPHKELDEASAARLIPATPEVLDNLCLLELRRVGPYTLQPVLFSKLGS